MFGFLNNVILDCGVGCLDCGTVVNEFQENVQDCMWCDSGFAHYIDPATQLGACTRESVVVG